MERKPKEKKIAWELWYWIKLSFVIIINLVSLIVFAGVRFSQNSIWRSGRKYEKKKEERNVWHEPTPRIDHAKILINVLTNFSCICVRARYILSVVIRLRDALRCYGFHYKRDVWYERNGKTRAHTANEEKKTISISKLVSVVSYSYLFVCNAITILSRHLVSLSPPLPLTWFVIVSLESTTTFWSAHSAAKRFN